MAKTTTITVKEKLYTALELSRVNPKVPFLLMGNPGTGKTTSIQHWAEENDYHLQTLVAADYEPSDIKGFQVNEPGVSHLVHKDPEWFTQLWKAHDEGKKTVLFLDEISAVPTEVQRPMLTMIFNRASGNGKAIPDDTLIIAAANYYENLDPSADIITPLLNRFCIINALEDMSNLDVMYEFSGAVPKTFNFEYVKPSEEKEKSIRSELFTLWEDILTSYGDKDDSSIGFLDFQNNAIGGIYRETEGNLYNVLSPRTKGYWEDSLIALSGFKRINPYIVTMLTKGLMGLGTNNFLEKSQAEKFVATMAQKAWNIISTCSIDAEDVSFKDLSVREASNKLTLSRESGFIGKNLTAFTDKCRIEYGDAVKTAGLTDNWTRDDAAKFIDDMDAIYEQITTFEDQDLSDAYKKDISELVAIHAMNSFIYSGLAGTDPSLNGKYGVFSPRTFNEIRIVLLKNKTISLVADRATGNAHTYFSIPKDLKNLNDINLSNQVPKDTIVKFGSVVLPNN